MFSLDGLSENLGYVGESLIDSLTDAVDLTYAIINGLITQQFAIDHFPTNSILVKNFGLSLRLRKVGLSPPDLTIRIVKNDDVTLLASSETLVDFDSNFTTTELDFTVLDNSPSSWIGSKIEMVSGVAAAGLIQMSEMDLNYELSFLNTEIASGGCVVSGNSNQNSVKNLFVTGGALCGGQDSYVSGRRNNTPTVATLSQFRNAFKGTIRGSINVPIWPDRTNPLMRLWIN